MKKIFLLFTLILIVCCPVFAKVKKVTCNKPIYYFEDADKNVLFDELDKFVQAQHLYAQKFYPELGYMTFNYKPLGKKTPEVVTVSLKQQSHDVYLFINISKANTAFEKNLYTALKKHSKNSYLIKDELLCKDFTKDSASIDKNRKSVIKEVESNSDVYKIGVNRYIGYDKKTYVKDRLKAILEKVNKFNAAGPDL